MKSKNKREVYNTSRFFSPCPGDSGVVQSAQFGK